MSQRSKRVRFVCISDTHNHAPGEGYKLPEGDVLVHAGDLTNQGSVRELQHASEWLARAQFAVKIVVAGNHDLGLDARYRVDPRESGWTVQPEDAEAIRRLYSTMPGVHYLEHSSCLITLPDSDTAFKVFGSPYSPDRGKQNWAFQYGEEKAEALWSGVTADTDVLITHTPPAGCCDASRHWREGGCSTLNAALARIRPALHICGHCHEGRGAQVLRWNELSTDGERVFVWQDPGIGNRKQSSLDLTGTRGGHRLQPRLETAVINASIMARSWEGRGRGRAKEFNKPIVVDVEFGIGGDDR